MTIPETTSDPVETGPGQPVSALPLGSRTVLVVDDEPSVRLLVTEILADLGYRSLEAADGATGLGLLQSADRIDLLVTDIGLPRGMDGNQLVEAARAIRPGLAVLIISGYADTVALGNRPLGSRTMLLSKPFTLDDLACRVRELIA